VARRSGTTLHQTHRPRLSPTMSPASASILVWWEIVGWLRPRALSRLQLHASPSAATMEKSRRRMGSARAAKMLA
jgi:hypothetical protein